MPSQRGACVIKHLSDYVWLLLLVGTLGKQAGHARGSAVAIDVAVVSTAIQLQEAVGLGVHHIVLNDHIDTVDIPHTGQQFFLERSMLAGRQSSAKNATGTQSIRVRGLRVTRALRKLANVIAERGDGYRCIRYRI